MNYLEEPKILPEQKIFLQNVLLSIKTQYSYLWQLFASWGLNALYKTPLSKCTFLEVGVGWVAKDKEGLIVSFIFQQESRVSRTQDRCIWLGRREGKAPRWIVCVRQIQVRQGLRPIVCWSYRQDDLGTICRRTFRKSYCWRRTELPAAPDLHMCNVTFPSTGGLGLGFVERSTETESDLGLESLLDDFLALLGPWGWLENFLPTRPHQRSVMTFVNSTCLLLTWWF